MATERPSKDEIFNATAELSDPAERSAYLEQVCGADLALRAEIEELLGHDSSKDSLLDRSAMGIEATLDLRISEKPGTQIGPYKLLQQIGEGGMGTVFMAEQKQPVRRRVALKIIKPGMDTRQVIARFETERQALAMMEHPNIARVLDAGATDSGRPFFVMELVNGVPITQHCDEQHLTTRERLELFLPVCRAVQHAHQKGIIHRDLKPSNILVARFDGQAAPKVIDFGVARAANQSLNEKTLFTEFGQIVGTLDYMSPEQAERSQIDIDTRSDVYSLGVVLYELLTGQTPFDRERLRSAAWEEMLRIIREEEPPKPSTRLSSAATLPSIAANRNSDPAKLGLLIRGEIDWIVMKALDKDRNRRFETANAFAQDIQRYLNDEAVVACPPSASYKFRKFARRNKTLIGTTAAIAVSLIAGIITTSWQAYLVGTARDRAVMSESIAEERLNIVEAQKSEIEKEKENAVTAAARADMEAEKARTEAAIASAVNNFLNDDLLEMGDAALQMQNGLSPDPNVKLLTLLNRAADKIESRFSDNPLVEAAIRNTLGRTFRAIGAYKKAERELQRALELSQRELGDSHVETCVYAVGLASIYFDQARYREAEKLLLKSLDYYQSALGEEAPKTLWCMNNLGVVYQFQARYHEAEQLFKKALDIYQRTLGEEHQDTANTLFYLANLHMATGRYSEAEQLHKQALANRQKTLGREHPDTLDSMNNLASLYTDKGRFVEAEELHKQTLAIQRRILGDEHPDTQHSNFNLAAVYDCQGRYEDAEQLHRQTLENLAITLGDEHPLTLGCMSNLAVSYRNQSRLAEAEELLQKTLRIKQRVLGNEHPTTLTSMHNLASVYLEQSRLLEAEELFLQTLDEKRQVLGDEHQHTLLSISALANVYIEQGRLPEAEKIHRDTLEIQWRTLGENHPERLRTLNNLAHVYSKQGRYEEAERLFRESLDAFLKTQGDGAPETKVIKLNLASVCSSRAWELATSANHDERNPSEAVRIAQEAVDFVPENANYWDNLGVALLSNDEGKRAVDVLEKAREMSGGRDEYHRIFLAMAYAKVDRLDDAIAEYLQHVNWLVKNTRPSEQYRFCDEAEALIGDDVVLESLFRKIAEHPNDSSAFLGRAYFYERRQRFDEAASDYLHVLDQIRSTGGAKVTPWWQPLSRLAFNLAENHEIDMRLQNLRPDDLILKFGRFRSRAARRQWNEAESLLDEIAAAKSDELYLKQLLAAVRFQKGDFDGYRKMCNLLLDRAATDKYPPRLETTIRFCLLSPGLMLDRIEEIHGMLDTASARVQEFPNLTKWCSLNAGLLAYREGNLESVANRLEVACNGPAGDNCREIAELLLSMAEYQVSHEERARRVLQTKIDQLERKWSLPGAWEFKVITTAEVIRHEAEALLSVVESAPLESPTQHEGDAEMPNLSVGESAGSTPDKGQD